MIYSLDLTEEGKKCEIIVKGINVPCTIISAYEITNKSKVIHKRYRLKSKENTIYDNVLSSEIIFKK